MVIDKLFSDGRLKVIYSKCETEREVASSIGLPYSRLIYYFTHIHPEVDRLSWLKMPEHLNLRWLKQQHSEQLNERLRVEYAFLGCASFKKKYSILGSLDRIKAFLQIRRGQSNYISSYSRVGYSAKIFSNPLAVESDFKYWFLGYFLGDGSVTFDRGFRVAIYSKDEQVIHLLYQSFGLDMAHIRGVCDLREEKNKVYIFHTTDRSLESILKEYKFLSDKSHQGWYGWDLIPDKFRPAFLRGLYESDGTCTFSPIGNSCSLRWLGHASYIEAISSYLGTSTYKQGCLSVTGLHSKEKRQFVRRMYPTSHGIGTPEYPCNMRKATIAFKLLERS